MENNAEKLNTYRLRNQELTDEVAKCQQRIAELEQGLRKYGVHYFSCPGYRRLKKCDCGLSMVRDRGTI